MAARYVQAEEDYLMETRKGDYVILDIRPRYYSAWTIMKVEPNSSFTGTGK
jgi:hypothetical protein